MGAVGCAPSLRTSFSLSEGSGGGGWGTGASFLVATGECVEEGPGCPPQLNTDGAQEKEMSASSTP